LGIPIDRLRRQEALSMTTDTLQTSKIPALEDVVRLCDSIDAAALYGSVARGDVENYSDVDLLLVCQNQRN